MDNKMIADYVKALSPERVLFLHNSFGKDPKIHPMGELDKTYKDTPPLEFMSLAEKGNFCMGDSYFFQDGDKLCSFSDPKDCGLLDMLTVSARSIVKGILDKLERYNDFDIIRMHNEITEEEKHIYPMKDFNAFAKKKMLSPWNMLLANDGFSASDSYFYTVNNSGLKLRSFSFLEKYAPEGFPNLRMEIMDAVLHNQISLA